MTLPTPPDPQTVTRLLRGVRAGEAPAVDALLPLVYDELRALSHAMFSEGRGAHTLQPTALVHEAWMKLGGHLDKVEDRPHFFAIASRAMRQVLTDHARRRNAQKRGGTRRRVTLDTSLVAAGSSEVDLADLDDSLTRLAALHERHARVVELRILGGLSIADTAELLEVSPATVEADWFTAKAWLRTELRKAK